MSSLKASSATMKKVLEMIFHDNLCHHSLSLFLSVQDVVKGVTIVKHTIDPEVFKHELMTFGDKMTQEEIDDIFGEFEFDDDGFILTKSVVRDCIRA